jgi:hypothetical protein
VACHHARDLVMRLAPAAGRGGGEAA